MLFFKAEATIINIIVYGKALDIFNKGIFSLAFYKEKNYMKSEQINLLITRLIRETKKYNGVEPDNIKQIKDRDFCLNFFGSVTADVQGVDLLVNDSIISQNESELELLIMLIDHFNITKYFGKTIAPLVIESWHHLHDRIARILMFDKNPETTDYLYKGATYHCDNLEYQSDYCEFNRKCMYGLYNINTEYSILLLKSLVDSNEIIANIAKNILKIK